jgi:hypothetical protein
MASGLPHLRSALKAFMTGAADTWKRFGAEYAADGVIVRLSPAARARIYINPTNDHNEGALGRLRAAMRQWASLSLSMHNAKSKYAVNGTHEFLRSPAVTDALRIWLRGEARHRVDSGRDRKRRQELIEHETAAVEKKQQVEAECKQKAADKQAELAKLIPLLDVGHIEANHKQITATEIVQQINWHRQFVEKGVIPQKTLIGGMNKADKVRQLIAAVTRFNQDILPKLQLLAAAAMTSGAANIDSDSPMADIALVENWDAQDDLNDADMLDDY